jgi:hypothetical protein
MPYICGPHPFTQGMLVTNEKRKNLFLTWDKPDYEFTCYYGKCAEDNKISYKKKVFNKENVKEINICMRAGDVTQVIIESFDGDIATGKISSLQFECVDMKDGWRKEIIEALENKEEYIKDLNKEK